MASPYFAAYRFGDCIQSYAWGRQTCQSRSRSAAGLFLLGASLGRLRRLALRFGRFGLGLERHGAEIGLHRCEIVVAPAGPITLVTVRHLAMAERHAGA